MASLVTYSDGLRRLDFFMTPNGQRRSIRLGRMKAKQAKSYLARVSDIISDRLMNRPHDAELSQWLAGLDETMLSRLRAVGLADGVGVTQTTLGSFLDRAFSTLAVKESTAKFYGHTRRNLCEYFTRGRALADITTSDADAWRSWLVEHEKLGKATVARRVVAARSLWRKAIRWKLTADNPFEGVKGGSQQNERRKRFVTRQMIQQVIDACPDVEWRLMVGLARYGGLRCPSEVLSLRWSDVDWDRGMLCVTSRKTEHHDGGGSRIVPIFPELRPFLMDAFEAAPEGAERVIDGYAESTPNLRTHFLRIIRRAGVEPWPRLWNNLRASRESELMREYDLSTVCGWIGNSPVVAAKHYAMSTDLDADFKRAISMTDSEAQQNAQQSPTSSECQQMSTELDGERKPLKDNSPDNNRQSVTTAVEAAGWAILDSNQ